MKALIITKNNISKSKASVNSLVKLLEKKKIKYQILSFDKVDDFYEEIHKKEFKNDFDLLISFGGDGTILKSARVARKLDIPILGINVGTVGFLTAINDFSKVDAALDKILKKKYDFIERTMLEVKVFRDGKEKFDAYAVNEATLTTINLCKIGKYKISIGNKKNKDEFTELSADGLIIATPTGSTAHSLSAGGPIVAADVNCFIITPICPHTLNQRSFIVNLDNEIFIDNLMKNQIIDIDGRAHYNLEKDDLIVIKKLKKTVKYIVFEDKQFLTNIRNKIKAL